MKSYAYFTKAENLTFRVGRANVNMNMGVDSSVKLYRINIKNDLYPGIAFQAEDILLPGFQIILYAIQNFIILWAFEPDLMDELVAYPGDNGRAGSLYHNIRYCLQRLCIGSSNAYCPCFLLMLKDDLDQPAERGVRKMFTVLYFITVKSLKVMINYPLQSRMLHILRLYKYPSFAIGPSCPPAHLLHQLKCPLIDPEIGVAKQAVSAEYTNE